MEQFATALGQAAFVDVEGARGAFLFRVTTFYWEFYWELVPTLCTRVPSQPFHTVT